jgi:hypothetical protein
MQGDDNIENEYQQTMKTMATAINDYFNGEALVPTVAFVLLVTDITSDHGRVNFVSNINSEDTINIMKRYISKYEESHVTH